jgi:hypothetical protein
VFTLPGTFYESGLAALIALRKNNLIGETYFFVFLATEKTSCHTIEKIHGLITLSL